MPGDQTWMKEKYSNLVEQGLDWKLRALETASEPRCIVDGRSNIMLCANNYLNLTTHDKVVNAMVEATKKYGAGSGSVRAIAGNMQLHEDLETTIAEFKGVEAALTYSAGYTANVEITVSKSSFVNPELIIHLILALSLATIGKTIGKAKIPFSYSWSDNSFAKCDSPHITGIIGVSETPVSKPRDCISDLKYSVLFQSLA